MMVVVVMAMAIMVMTAIMIMFCDAETFYSRVYLGGNGQPRGWSREHREDIKTAVAERLPSAVCPKS